MRTEKAPSVPEMPVISASVISSMLTCRPTSTSLGARIHMEQSFVGNVLSSWAITPPMAGDFSTR